MKKKAIILIAVFSVFAAGFCYGQTRNDILVYIPTPTGGDSAQQSFFKENFEMETIAAGYATTESQRDADYTLKLEIRPHMIMYDDGTEEQAPYDEKEHLLELRLVRTEDDTEIVMFDFPFNEVEEMYDYNLYLLYQAMANVPLTKLTDILEYDHWRNKWLYLRGSFDYPITFYALTNPNSLSMDIPGNQTVSIPLDNKVMAYPGASLGVELQFLNWMSAEAGFQLMFGDPVTTTLIPVINLELKFPLKPAKHFMIEPYGAVSFPMATIENVLQFPKIGVGGGVQFGVKGGEMGAFFVDVNYVYNLGQVVMKNTSAKTTPDKINYNRFVLGLGIGYKIGFFNRNPDDAVIKNY